MTTESDDSFLSDALLSACEQTLGYTFKQKSLLKTSLTHASIAPTRLHSNERMEFLGDAILGAIVCDRLFALNPNDEEGPLTQMKSEVVSRTACAQAAISLGLQQFVLMSKGLHLSPELPHSVLAGIFESVIAAIYLDGGFEAAFEFINRNLDHLINHAAESEHIRNSKSLLQQYTQKELSETPTYMLVEEVGPDHNKSFLVAAVVGEKTFAPAWGTNKKEAEQKAALNALCQLLNDPIPYNQETIANPESTH